jgi:type IV pilus assembly protein PilE
MIKVNQKGFSLIELLLVVTIVGIVAALAVPSFQRGIRAAENGTTFATLRTIGSSQVAFYSRSNRFGRITEINTAQNEIFGVSTGNVVIRGRYTFEMSPTSPTDEQLRNEFTITATRSVTDDTVYVYELNQTGTITQILP